MKIIFNFGTETKLFDKKNRVHKRIREYAVISDLYYNFTFTSDIKFKDHRDADTNFINVAIYGSNKFMQVFNLFKIVKQEFKNLNLQNKIVNKEKERKEVYFSSQDPFEIGLLIFILSKIYKAKFIVQMHTDISHKNFRNESFRNNIQFHIANLIFKKAYKIRVVSVRMQNYLINKLKINTEKIAVLSVFVDLDKFNIKNTLGSNLENKKEEKEIDFLILCRIEKVKNIELAIESIKIINKNRQENNLNNSNLKIVGDGSYKKYLQSKYDKNLNENKFIFWQNFTEDIASEYRKAKYFLISSDYEGYGLTAIESVSVGTPVIMTPVGTAYEFIKDRVNGFVVKDFTIDGYVKTIEKSMEFKFDENLMKNSLLTLYSKKEYLQKMREIYS